MRKALLPAIVIITASLLLIRLFYLQIIDDSFKLKSENNAIKIKYDYPERGYVYDRYGKLLIANQPSYDIMVVPKDVKDLDTIEFCSLLDITKEFFIAKMKKARVYSPMLPSVFLPQLNKLEYAAFQEKIRKFSGFYIQKRSLRDYQVDYVNQSIKNWRGIIPSPTGSGKTAAFCAIIKALPLKTPTLMEWMSHTTVVL